MTTVINRIATLVVARQNCLASGNDEWLERHTVGLERIVREHLPSGSGFDAGTSIDKVRSRRDRIVFRTSFHHMDENGHYDGWTEHDVVVTPAFDGFDLRVTGRDRNGIKDYIGDVFHEALSADIRES